MATDSFLRTPMVQPHPAATVGRENRLTAVALNEIGTKLNTTGQHDEAIAMFDAAAEAVRSRTARSPLVSQLLHWGCQQIKQQHTEGMEFQQPPPDLYLEGECDVGPRPLRKQLHFDSSMCSDEILLDATVWFNEALVHHSKSELDDAMEYYSVALTALSKNMNTGLSNKANQNRASYLLMMIHNNMGQLSYVEEDDDSSMHYFQAAVFWAKQVSDISDVHEFYSSFADVLSNFCRSQWNHDHVDEDTYHAFQTVLQLRLVTLPADHVDVACAHYNLGVMEYARHENDRAKSHLQEYLNIATKKKCHDIEMDPIPAMTYILLIENEDKEDKLSLELSRALHTLIEKREDCGPLNMEVASLLNYVGTLLFHRKDLHSAVFFYREELRLEKTLMGAEAGISISVTYNNIGRILQELGELSEAIGCYQSALKAEMNDNSYAQAAAFATGSIDLSTSTPPNLSSTIWYNLGIIYDKMGARREAIMSFQMALGLRRKMLDSDHPDIACLWYNIGTLQMEINRIDDAIQSFKEALRIRRLGKSTDDPRYVVTTLKKLAVLQQNLGKIDDALSTLNDILEIQESFPCDIEGKTSGTIGQTLRKIADLYEAKGDLVAALAAAQRSYLVLKSVGALSRPDTAGHLKAVEEVAKSLLVLGSLYNENCESTHAHAAHKEARLIVADTMYRLGQVSYPALQPLLDACSLHLLSACAPVA